MIRRAGGQTVRSLVKPMRRIKCYKRGTRNKNKEAMVIVEEEYGIKKCKESEAGEEECEVEHNSRKGKQ